MAKNQFKKMYEVNDIFSVLGYALLFMGALGEFTNATVQVIPVDSIWSVFTGLVTTDASGNLIALFLGAGALLVEKYIKFGKLM